MAGRRADLVEFERAVNNASAAIAGVELLAELVVLAACTPPPSRPAAGTNSPTTSPLPRSPCLVILAAAITALITQLWPRRRRDHRATRPR